MKLKPLPEQVVVVLGASSGIGRESALRLAARGARVVVAARGEPGLQSLVREITAAGGRATYVVCDAVDPAQVRAVADAAVATYGRIDTWVNVAGVIAHSPFDETEPEQFRRLMEINYLGQVHGARAALPELRAAGGGALVFVTSAESAVAMPGHSAYAASKHAVEGLVSALRRELLAESVPISVTSVRPSSTNTPIFSNAAHGGDVDPEAPPPIYPVSVAADCVVHAAEHPRRVLWAGGSGRAAALLQAVAPRLLDEIVVRMQPLQRSSGDEGDAGTLSAPNKGETDAAGGLGNRERSFSLYTWLQLRPGVTAALGIGGVASVLAGMERARRGRRSRRG